jgi:hypothetical protein
MLNGPDGEGSGHDIDSLIELCNKFEKNTVNLRLSFRTLLEYTLLI